MECPICYEAITADTGIVTTSCNHSYHFSCISGWYIKQDKGTCPCCRKEMNKEEDFSDILYDGEESQNDEDSQFEEESQYDEVEFTRRELQDFIEARGGHLTSQMSDAICEVIGAFTQTELNSLLIGNTGKVLTEQDWNELLNRPVDIVEEQVEEQGQGQGQTLRITIVGDERRIVVNPLFEDTAATKIQSVWRIQKAAQTLVMLHKN